MYRDNKIAGARSQLRSSTSLTPEQVLEQFFQILKKHRRAVLKNDRAGIRAFGIDLERFGGKWAMKVGYWTVPMEWPERNRRLRAIQKTVFKEWRELR